jgi:hypothetical protein
MVSKSIKVPLTVITVVSGIAVFIYGIFALKATDPHVRKMLFMHAVIWLWMAALGGLVLAFSGGHPKDHPTPSPGGIPPKEKSLQQKN